jgi:hypothetical protein
MDATEYLTSTEANKKRLDEAIAEAKDGQDAEISLRDLWIEEFKQCIEDVNLAKQGKIKLRTAAIVKGIVIEIPHIQFNICRKKYHYCLLGCVLLSRRSHKKYNRRLNS